MPFTHREETFKKLHNVKPERYTKIYNKNTFNYGYDMSNTVQIDLSAQTRVAFISMVSATYIKIPAKYRENSERWGLKVS